MRAIDELHLEFPFMGARQLSRHLELSRHLDKRGLKTDESVSETRSDIARYIDWYNAERGHSSHDGQTPDEVWMAGQPPLQEAA